MFRLHLSLSLLKRQRESVFLFFCFVSLGRVLRRRLFLRLTACLTINRASWIGEGIGFRFTGLGARRRKSIYRSQSLRTLRPPMWRTLRPLVILSQEVTAERQGAGGGGVESGQHLGSDWLKVGQPCPCLVGARESGTNHAPAEEK